MGKGKGKGKRETPMRHKEVRIPMPWLLYRNKCRSNAGLRTFHARGTRLWNRLDDKLKNMTNESNFKKHLFEKFLNINASRKHFSITRTF